MNESELLLFKLLNYFRMLAVFFDWFILVLLITEALMSSRIRLLMTPISDFDGFIRRHVGWSEKFGLWSFSVTNAPFVANFSMRSSNFSRSAILADFALSSPTSLSFDFL